MMSLEIRILVVTCAASACLSGAPSVAVAQITSSPVPATKLDAAPAGEGVSLRDLFADTVRDFRRLPSAETATLLSVGGFAASMGFGVDRDVSRGMSRSATLGSALAGGETIGGARMQLAGALATYTLGRVTDNRRVTTIGADLIRAQIVTQTLTATIKTAVGRTRPDGTGYSFPSGHSSVTFATATVLQRNLGWKAGLPAYGLATYVAASRVQDRRHFLSDVAFGAALGIAGGRTVTIGHGDTRFAVSPAAAIGGAGVQFTWVGR